jgi:hypothetical protein
VMGSALLRALARSDAAGGRRSARGGSARSVGKAAQPATARCAEAAVSSNSPIRAPRPSVLRAHLRRRSGRERSGPPTPRRQPRAAPRQYHGGVAWRCGNTKWMRERPPLRRLRRKNATRDGVAMECATSATSAVTVPRASRGAHVQARARRPQNAARLLPAIRAAVHDTRRVLRDPPFKSAVCNGVDERGYSGRPGVDWRPWHAVPK